MVIKEFSKGHATGGH